MENIKQLDRDYIVNSYQRFDLQLTHGKKELLYDENGKEYIDLGSGIAVNIFGACDDKWTAAIEAQLCKIQHTSNLYYTEPQVVLAKMLCEKSGMKKVFFSNSGAEANECAIKTARKYSFDKYGEGRNKIITMRQSFHGRTVTTLSATGQDSFHNYFFPFTEGFGYVTPNDKEELISALSDNGVCAVMLEVVQGEGGVCALNADYLELCDKLCKEKDLIFIVDEVQTGNGRCGKFYAYMNFAITPDVVTSAKGLGGGLPIGCTLMNEKTENTLTYGMHGSTFGGNPVVCAGAASIIERIDDKLLCDVMEKSNYIKNELEGAIGIEAVSGLGLMLGIKTVRPAKEIVAQCMQNGVLVLTAKDKVRLLPPLDIKFDNLKKAIAVIKQAAANI